MLKFISKIVIDLVKLIVTLAIILAVLKVFHCNVYIDSAANNVKDFVTVTRDINIDSNTAPAIEEETVEETNA